MKDELAASGATIDAIYYCPHHPDEHCMCRKPKTALFLQAAKELDIDLGHSYMVGDTQGDIEAGNTIGCKTVLVTTNDAGLSACPDYKASNLGEAVKWILR